MLWLYLHFPNLQLDSMFNDQQGVSEHGVIILDAKDNRIVQLNAKAQQAGIQVDMSLGTAAALNPELQVLPHNPKQEQHILSGVADSLYLITADISFFAEQGLLLRIGPMLNLYQGLDAYWQALKLQLAPLNLRYQFATGMSPFAACMLAQRGWNRVVDDRQELVQALRQSPLGFCPLPKKVMEKLKRVGVHSMGDLLDIPLTDMAKRFDIEVVTYIGKLTGEFKHPVSFYHPPQGFERYLELMYDIRDSQVLEHPLKHLLKSLENHLKIRDQIAFELTITLHQRDSEPLGFSVGAQQGEYTAKAWRQLLALKLESITLQAPVFGITLGADKVQLRSPDKQDLFSGKKGTLSRLQLLALLQAKLGETAVYSPILADDWRPELIQSGPAHVTQDRQALLLPLRPGFLLAKPQPLQETVSIQLGPERLCTGWWDGKAINRDYFLARSPSGQWYWVFRTPDDDSGAKWYVHGLFS